MSDKPLNILFLCTRNSARSLLAEACLNFMAAGRFRAFSAGSWPTAGGEPDVMALEVLRAAGIPAAGLRSKSWNEVSEGHAPRMDLVITLCDAVADEVCPVWPAYPETAHWSYPNPALVEGSPEERLSAYRAILHSLHKRLELLTSLPARKLERVVVAEFAQELAHAQDG